MPITAALTTLELPMPPAIPRTSIICNTPRPAMDITVNNMSSPGNAIQASTNLCTARSNLPPRNPEMPPIRAATTTVRTLAAKPTTMERRAPTMRRLKKSRPNWSVPSGYWADGPCSLSAKCISQYGKGASVSAKILTRINIRMTIPLTVPSGFSFTILIKKSANWERFFRSLIGAGIPVASLILLILPPTGSEPWGLYKDKSCR